ALLLPLYFFFFTDAPTSDLYTLSLHDALPISHDQPLGRRDGRRGAVTPADETDEEIEKERKREQEQDEPDPAHGRPREERWLDPPSREQAGYHHDHRSRNEGDEHDRTDGRGEQGPLA